MAPRNTKTYGHIAHEFRYFRVYKNGRVEKLVSDKKVPPYDDPFTGVRTKDVMISRQPNISARIFLPSIADPTPKLPLIFYVHGNSFSMCLAFAPRYHIFLTSVVAEADAIAICFSYGGSFPERPRSECYADSWAALRWVAAHAAGNGPEPWLNDHADFGKFFICGNSSGGNISHNLAVRVGSHGGFPGLRFVGLALLHPYFGGKVRKHDEMMRYLLQLDIKGFERDPRVKPAAEDLAVIPCERVLVAVAGDDDLREAGTEYYQELKRIGWKGTVEIEDTAGGGHGFFLYEINHERTLNFIKRLALFINKEDMGVDRGREMLLASKL